MSGRRRSASRSRARSRSRSRGRSRSRRKKVPEVGDYVDVRIRPGENWRRACVSGITKYKKKKTRIQCMLCDHNGRANPEDKVSIPFEPTRLRRAKPPSLPRSGQVSPTLSLASFSSFGSRDSICSVTSEDIESMRSRSSGPKSRRRRHSRAYTEVVIRENSVEPPESWQELDPLKWRKAHVATWILSLTGLGIPAESLTQYSQRLEWRSVSGRMLFKLTEVELRDKFHIVEPEHIEILLQEIRHKNPKRRPRHNRAQTAPQASALKRKEGPQEIGWNEEYKIPDYGIILDDGRSFLEPKLRDYRASSIHHEINKMANPVEPRPTVAVIGTNKSYEDAPYGDEVLEKVANTLEERLMYRTSSTNLFEARKRQDPVPHRPSVKQIGRNVHFQEPDYELDENKTKNSVTEARVNFQSSTKAFEARKRANPRSRNPTVRVIGVNKDFQEPEYETQEDERSSLAERINFRESTTAFEQRRKANPLPTKPTVQQIGVNTSYKPPEYSIPEDTDKTPFPQKLTYRDASTQNFEERKQNSPLGKRPTVREIGVNQDYDDSPYDIEEILKQSDGTGARLMYRSASTREFEKRKRANPVPRRPTVQQIGVNTKVEVPEYELPEENTRQIYPNKLMYRSASTTNFEIRRRENPVQKRPTVNIIGHNKKFEEPEYEIQNDDGSKEIYPARLMYRESSTTNFETRKQEDPVQHKPTVQQIGVNHDYQEPEYADEVMEDLENMDTLRERLPTRVELDRHSEWVRKLKRSNVQIPKALEDAPKAGFYSYVRWLDALREFAKNAEIDESLWHTRELDDMTDLMKEEIELYQAEHGEEYLGKFRLDKRMYSGFTLEDLVVEEKTSTRSIDRSETSRSDASEFWSDDESDTRSFTGSVSSMSSRSVERGQSSSKLKTSTSFKQLLPDGSQVRKRIQVPRATSFKMKIPRTRSEKQIG